ncbi:MAG: tetratricopeptide repeat protein [Salinivirgaceae bacterium]|jgi:hypothetical protein|nr:hypothetical protein [Bacteroidales bacterium]
MRNFSKILLLVIFINLFSYVSAQNGGLQISGFLRDGWKPISGSMVQLYSYGSLLMVAETDLAGRFSFELELNREYQLIFAAYGYVTKRLTIDTNVRENEEREWVYWFNMEIFPEIPNTDFSVFQLPVAKIYYSPNFGEFDFDYNYSGKFKNLSNNLISYVKKERYAQYNKHISLADNGKKSGDFVKAIDHYLMARVYDPYVLYPTEQINSLETQLLRKSNKYKAFIELQQLGDSCMRGHDFSKASVFYTESASMYPENDYAWYKANLADTLNSRFDNSMYIKLQYNHHVSLADKYISNRDYINSLYHYELASKLNPNDEYVFKQIKFLGTQLNISVDRSDSEQYRKLIENGDRCFQNSDYDKAEQYYNEALTINQSDQYVKIQIDKINRKKELFKQFSFSPESRTKEFIANLAKTYDTGLTQEFHEWDGKKVVRIIINDGREAREYVKTVSDSDTLYYRNGQNISKVVFQTETGH